MREECQANVIIIDLAIFPSNFLLFSFSDIRSEEKYSMLGCNHNVPKLPSFMRHRASVRNLNKKTIGLLD
jgi:hypothetical protein